MTHSRSLLMKTPFVIFFRSSRSNNIIPGGPLSFRAGADVLVQSGCVVGHRPQGRYSPTLGRGAATATLSKHNLQGGITSEPQHSSYHHTPHPALLLCLGQLQSRMSEPPAESLDESLLETARAWLPLALSAAATVFLGRFLTRYVETHERFLVRV